MKSILSIAALSLLWSAATAQTVTGTLDGRVADPTGAVVPRVQVTAKNVETGVERTTNANEAGYFQMPFLPLGIYDVTTQLAGFASVRAEGVVVTLNKTTTLDLTLRISNVEESVSVSDVAPLIDVRSGEVRRSIDDTLVEALPSSGRNFLGFATLFPGFQTNPISGQNNYTLSSGSSVSFNGTGTRGTTFMTDGVSNDDSSENQNRQGVNISTIKEMQIVTNNFSAEFGRGFGAVVLVETKSGTNQMHGEGYYYTQNSALNARRFFDNAAGSHVDQSTGRLVPNVPKAVSKSHRVGGTAGGAIVKDRLFYFGSIERFWQPGTTTVTSYLLPPEWRRPQVDPSLLDAAARRAWVQSVIDRFPSDLQPNNAPVSPYAYTAPMPRSSHQHDYSGRVDWHKSDRDFIYGRYQYSNFFSGLTREPVRGENVRSDHAFQSVGLTYTHIFSPSTVGEFRAGFGRRRITVDFLDPADQPPVIRWSFTGFAPIMGNAGAFPNLRFQNDFQEVYNLSTQPSAEHTLKFGADIRRIQINDHTENFNRGFWTFGSQPGYDSMQNFLRGVVTTYQKGYGPAYVGQRLTELNFYAQDNWRAARGLTLTLGMRVEYVGAPTEVNNLVDAGYSADKYVEPRFGFAYSPSSKDGLVSRLTGGPGVTSMRGGFGLFHGRVFQSIFNQGGASVRFNPPNAALLTFTNPEQPAQEPTQGFVFKAGPPIAQVSLANVNSNLHMPYTEQWNLTVERQLKWNAAFEASYIGNRGIGLIFYNWKNRAQFPITSTQPTTYRGAAIFSGVSFDKIDPNLFNATPAPGFISLQQARNDARRSDGRYSSILEVANASWSYYNALQLAYKQRMKAGLTLQVAYTWSKNIDTGSESTFVGAGDINAAISETQGQRSLRGPSRLSQPQRFTVTYRYELPLWRDQKGPSSWNPYLATTVGRVLGGWELSGVTTFASGNPYTVVLGYDLNGDGIGGDRPYILNPGLLGTSVDNGRVNPATGRKFSQDQLPSTAFYPSADIANATQWPWFPGTGVTASLGRNTFWTHGQNNWDLALIKNIRLVGESHHLQFRADMFTLFHSAQFDQPAFTPLVDTAVPGWPIPPRFGETTSQRNSPRFMQMSLRYSF